MFYLTNSLKTVYVSDKWKTDNVTSSAIILYGATNIVGGNGTKYNKNNTSIAYAKIDEPGSPGYFTKK